MSTDDGRLIMVPEEAAARLHRLRRTVVASLPELRTPSSARSGSFGSSRASKEWRVSVTKEPVKLPPGIVHRSILGSQSTGERQGLSRQRSVSSTSSEFPATVNVPRQSPPATAVAKSPARRRPSNAAQLKSAVAAIGAAKALRKGNEFPGPPREALLEHFLEVEKVTGVAGLRVPDWRKVENMMRTGPPDVNLKEKVFGWTPFLFCAHHGKSKILKLILEARANLKAACNQGNTALHIAARGGHHLCVDVLLDKAVDLNSTNSNGWTPLVWSAMHGHYRVCSTLIQAGADIHVVDWESRHAGMWAARHGHVDVVKLLLKAGLSLVYEDIGGLNILDHARQYLEIRSAIRMAGENDQGLLSAVRRADVSAVKQALSAGANVDSSDASGRTALSIALARGSEALVRLLVQRGANPSRAAKALVDNASNLAADMAEVLEQTLAASTRLLAAAADKQWEELDKELQVGAVVDARDDITLLSSLMHAAGCGADRAIVSLAKASAPMESRDAHGATALHFAAEGGTLVTASTLHFYDADPNATNFSGDSVLHMAVRADRGDMIQLLIAGRANIEAENADNYTPLQLAARKGSPVALATLLAYGADANRKDHMERSVFAVAVSCGSTECVSVMLNFLDPPPSLANKQFLAELRETHRLEQQAESQEEERLKKEEQPKLGAMEAQLKKLGDEEARKARVVPTQQSVEARVDELPEDDKDEGSPIHSDAEEAFGRQVSAGTSRSAAASRVSSPTTKRDGADSSSEESDWDFSEATDPEEEEKEPKPRKRPFGRFTLIFLAVRMREDLLEKGVENPISIPEVVKEADVNGSGVVTLAVHGRRKELVTMLLKAKALLNQKDNAGDTPLMIAAASGDQVMVEILLESGAEVKDKNELGLRAVDVAGNAKTKGLLARYMVDKAVKSTPASRSAAKTKADTSAAAKSRGNAVGKEVPDDKKEEDENNQPAVVVARVRLEDLPYFEHVQELEQELHGALRKMRVRPLRLHVAKDPITWRALGFAIVDFESTQQVETVLKFHGAQVFANAEEPLNVVREELPPLYQPPEVEVTK